MAHIISFINMKGGVAKTTLLVNVAHYLSIRGKKVLIIDVDPQFNATQCLMNPSKYISLVKSGMHTILDVFDRNKRSIVGIVDGEGEKPMPALEDIEPHSLNSLSKNLYILPGNLELYRLEMASGEGRENLLKRYIDKLLERRHFDYILIDTPPTPSVWMTSALIASGYYLIPVKPEPISFTGIDLLHSVIDSRRDAFGLDLQCIGVVLTIAETNTKVYEAAVKKLKEDSRWGSLLYTYPLSKRTEIARLQGKQQTILNGRNNEAAFDLIRIVRELVLRLGDTI